MKKQFIYNNKNRKTHRRHMRENMTVCEKLLWLKLRRKQLGHIFRRQYSIGPYIVDFYCPRKRLVVELDGKQHLESNDYDEHRTNYLNSLDIKVIRFWNSEVNGSMDEVISKIKSINTPPRLSSPPKVGGVRGGINGNLEGVRGSR